MLFSLTMSAQDVRLKVFGCGATLEEARLSAMRSAIEQAYGAFVSTETVIINDELKKDEITSVASGNIKHFDIVSETKTDYGYDMILDVIVSTEKLRGFVTAKAKGDGGVVNINVPPFLLNRQLQLSEAKSFKKLYDTTVRHFLKMGRRMRHSFVSNVKLVESSVVGANANGVDFKITLSYDVDVLPYVLYASKTFENLIEAAPKNIDMLTEKEIEENYLSENLRWRLYNTIFWQDEVKKYKKKYDDKVKQYKFGDRCYKYVKGRRPVPYFGTIIYVIFRLKDNSIYEKSTLRLEPDFPELRKFVNQFNTRLDSEKTPVCVLNAGAAWSFTFPLEIADKIKSVELGDIEVGNIYDYNWFKDACLEFPEENQKRDLYNKLKTEIEEELKEETKK